MKFLTITLALTIFAGSLVSVHSDEGKSLFKQLLQDVQEYTDHITSGFERAYGWALSTNTSWELRSQLENDTLKAEQYLKNLREELPTEFQGFVDAVENVSRANFEALLMPVALSPFPRRLEELYRRLEDVVAYYADPILEKVRGQAEALSARIQELSKKKEKEVASQLERLKTLEDHLAPRIRMILSQWQEFQKSLEPLVFWSQENFRKSVEVLNKPYVTSVLQEFQKYVNYFAL